MTTIVVVEDHLLGRQSLVKTLQAEAGMEVVGEAGRADEAAEMIARLQPDMALVDLEIPGGDGLGVAEESKKRSPATRVVILTMHDDDANIRAAMKLGVAGFIPKTASTDELLEGLASIAAGGSYLSPSVAKRVMDLTSGRGPSAMLTEREMEILKHMAKGLRPQELADQLFVSVKTIKNHLTSIYSKLGVETAAQAVAEAYRQGLVSRRS